MRFPIQQSRPPGRTRRPDNDDAGRWLDRRESQMKKRTYFDYLPRVRLALAERDEALPGQRVHWSLCT
jgi:hypothetical protein